MKRRLSVRCFHSNVDRVGNDACTDRSTMIRPMGTVITTKKLTASVGAEVLDVDRDRLLHDPGLPDAILDALEECGVLLFREIGIDDGEQIAFGRRLGNLVVQPAHPIPEITVITQGPDNPLAEYFRGNVHWHIDGAMDDVPCRAGILSARVMVAGDGGTEFASTYAAYDDLSDEEKDRFAGLRVIHSLEANLRLVYPNPTPDQLANWRSRPSRQHPLVWEHRSGRRSLVLGAAADHIVGMELDEGRRAAQGPVAPRDRSRARCSARLDGRRHGHLGQHRRTAPRHRSRFDVAT